MAVRVTAGRIVAAAFLAVGLAAAHFVLDSGGPSRPSVLSAQTGNPCVLNTTVTVDAMKDPAEGLMARISFGPKTSINSITEIGASTWCPRGCELEPNARSGAEDERCEEGDGLADGCARELEYCSGVQMILLDAAGNRVGAPVLAVTASGPVEAAGAAFHVPDDAGEFTDNSGACRMNVVYTTTGQACAPAASSASARSSFPASSAPRSSSASALSSPPASSQVPPSFAPPSPSSVSSAGASSSRMADFAPAGAAVEARGDDIVVHYAHRNLGQIDAGASETTLSFDMNFDGVFERTSTMPEQPLAAGSSVDRESQPIRLFGQRMKVQICSDSGDAVPEIATANNCTDVCYRKGSDDTSCAADPSVAPPSGASSARFSSSASSERASLSSSSTSALPDLVPEAPFRVEAVGKTDCRITAGVINVGPAPSRATYASLFIDLDGDGGVGEWQGDAPVADMQPFDGDRPSFLQSPCRLLIDEEMTARVCVDVKDAFSLVEEEDEGNNCYDHAITWPGVCGDGVVPALHYLTESCDDGARNVPLALAEKSSTETLTAAEAIALQSSGCLQDCTRAQCSDEQDNDADEFYDGDDATCKKGLSYLRGRNYESDECVPLFEGGADEDADALNVVFRFAGVRPDDAKGDARAWVEELMRYRPFSSSPGAIQYWYLTRELPERAGNGFCSAPATPAACPNPLPNVRYVDVQASYCRANAIGLSTLRLSTSDTPPVFVHEMGHMIGGLADEYVEVGARDGPFPPNCANNKEEAEHLWKDLAADPDVDYFPGCSYTGDNVRPTRESMMRNHEHAEARPPDGFKAVNIRAIAAELAPYGGAAIGRIDSASLFAAVIESGQAFAEAAFAVDLERQGAGMVVRGVRPAFVVTGVKPETRSDHVLQISAGGRRWERGIRTSDVMIAEEFTDGGIDLVDFRVLPKDRLTAYVGLGTVVPVPNDAVVRYATGAVVAEGMDAYWPADIPADGVLASVTACGEGDGDCPVPLFLDEPLPVQMPVTEPMEEPAIPWLVVASVAVAALVTLGALAGAVATYRRRVKNTGNTR